MKVKTEQRKHQRAKTHVPIKFRMLRDGAGEEGTGTISKNLSEGGIRFRTKEFVSMACRLMLEIDIPVLDKPVRAISKVAWIRKSPSGNEYEIGNRFIEISQKDKELVSEYVSSFNVHDDTDTF